MNSFILIAQQPLEFKGKHYEPGERFIADAFEAAPLQRQKLTIEAPREEQVAYGAQLRRQVAPLGVGLSETLAGSEAVAPAARRRGRPRKTPLATSEP